MLYTYIYAHAVAYIPTVLHRVAAYQHVLNRSAAAYLNRAVSYLHRAASYLHRASTYLHRAASYLHRAASYLQVLKGVQHETLDGHG